MAERTVLEIHEEIAGINRLIVDVQKQIENAERTLGERRDCLTQLLRERRTLARARESRAGRSPEEARP